MPDSFPSTLVYGLSRVLDNARSEVYIFFGTAARALFSDSQAMGKFSHISDGSNLCNVYDSV